MAKSHNQKIKILILAEILKGTDVHKVVTMQEILDRIGQHGISAERKSIYDDMEALRDFGYDIQYKRGRTGGYYLNSRPAGETGSSEMPSDTAPEGGHRFRRDAGAGDCGVETQQERDLRSRQEYEASVHPGAGKRDKRIFRGDGRVQGQDRRISDSDCSADPGAGILRVAYGYGQRRPYCQTQKNRGGLS